MLRCVSSFNTAWRYLALRQPDCQVESPLKTAYLLGLGKESCVFVSSKSRVEFLPDSRYKAQRFLFLGQTIFEDQLRRLCNFQSQALGFMRRLF